MDQVAQSVKDSVEATKAEYRRLGKSGLRISVPVLGAMSYGDPGWQPWVLGEDKVSAGDSNACWVKQVG